MQLLLKDSPILDIQDNGVCAILDFDRLPFALRREQVTFVEFMEWASNRTLSISRSFAKEILNASRLSQTNRYAVCKACRGVTLTDSYWIRQDGDDKTWKEVNLFDNPLSLFITEISLSGISLHYTMDAKPVERIHTPEYTTMGARAKSWIRGEEGLCLHKVGKYEIPSAEILEALGIAHVPYQVSRDEDISSFLSDERRQWLDAVGEKIVYSRLLTSEDVALVTFEEFRIFCEGYGLNPFHQAMEVDWNAYLNMQIGDYLLNNSDRHEQNWGFLMDNHTGKITGFCPLFDHDNAFSMYSALRSQTTEGNMTLLQAARAAQSERKLELECLESLERPTFLTEEAWNQVLDRKRALE